MHARAPPFHAFGRLLADWSVVVVDDDDADDDASDARESERSARGAHPAAHRGAIERRWPQAGRDGAGLPDRLRGQRAHHGEADDQQRRLHGQRVPGLRPARVRELVFAKWGFAWEVGVLAADGRTDWLTDVTG